MKRSLLLALILLFFMVTLPLSVFIIPDSEGDLSPSGDFSADTSKIKVLLTGEDKVITVSMTEYLIGALASEMPVLYHSQALNAQAAVCRTYAEKMIEQQSENPSEELKGAHISDDSSVHQGYMTQQERKEKFGEQYEIYEEKLSEAVKEGGSYVITYDGKLITAAFHAISSGQTESSLNLWGSDLPYLQPVQSAGDKLSPDYASTVTLTDAQFREKAASLKGAVLSDDSEEWIGEAETSDSGTVLSITVGGKEFTGLEIREAMGLRSPCFTVKHEDGSFVFSVIGYGHGAGMSQYGADYMARQGSSWQEIIKYYYKGTEIEKSK